VAHVSHILPDGRTLLDDVSFRIGEGVTAALVGPNGAGKTTLLRLVAGDLQPQEGAVVSTGGLGVMRQFIGTDQSQGITPMVRDLLLSVSAPRVREAAARLDAAELAMMERDDERAQLRYAAALAEWGEAGGYDAEVHWDACTVAAFGIPYDQCRWRDVGTLSGGEQKRLVLESLLRGNDGVLLLDEPDNYLDVPGKRWLEQQLASTPKTVLLVSHDRPDLAGRTPVEILMTEHALLINEAMSALSRYELSSCARQPFGTLSGGQQARLQILLLELAGSTLLLLDEPTDNLDLPSAEALQEGLESYQGTVLAVTHDRWFARSFERFLIFTPDGNVREATEPAWD